MTHNFSQQDDLEVFPDSKDLILERIRKIKTQDFMGSDKAILIEHETLIYKLSITKFGKLILTK